MKTTALLAAIVVAPLAAALQPPVRPEKPTETFSASDFRKHHGEIREHLDHIDAITQSLASQTAVKQRETMAFIVGFFSEHIVPHAQDEEKTLYPEADKAAGGPLTRTMRFEHQVVGRWIAELRTLSEQEVPDAAAFARRTQRLLGLLEAHFAAEEEVVVPALTAHEEPRR